MVSKLGIGLLSARGKTPGIAWQANDMVPHLNSKRESPLDFELESFRHSMRMILEQFLLVNELKSAGASRIFGGDHSIGGGFSPDNSFAPLDEQKDIE